MTRTLNADELSDWADDLDAFGSKDVEKPKEHDSGDDYLIPEQRFQKQMEVGLESPAARLHMRQ